MGHSISATTFKDSDKSFCSALEEHGVAFNRRHIQLGEVMASGTVLEIILSDGWGALAVACIAWANARKSRKISVTTKNGENYWIEGYSAKEVEKILPVSRQIAVIDTEKNQDDS